MFTNYMVDAIKQCVLDWITWHYSCQLVSTITGFIGFIVIISIGFYLAKRGIDNAEK